MSTNSEQIVQQIRAEFEALLQFVTGLAPSRKVSAYAMERGLLQHLLRLGQMLLQLYFVEAASRCRPDWVQDAKTNPLPYHSQKPRTYLSIFGKVRFARSYYYREGLRGQCPVDAALNLPVKGGSDLLRQWREQFAVVQAYHEVGPLLESVLGPQAFSTRALQEQIGEDAALVKAFYAQKEPPQPNHQATILVVQADGKGVPMRKQASVTPKARLKKGEKPGQKKEAVVTSVYTIAASVRTPQEVATRFFKQATEQEPIPSRRPGPHNKQVFATLEGKEAALAFTAHQVHQQEGTHICHRVALTDGSEALQQRVAAQFPTFTRVLDFVHATEYLWEAANALLGEGSESRTDWVVTHSLQMLSGQTLALIARLRQLAAEPGRRSGQKKVLLKVAAYYAKNQAFMRYDPYLAWGWPIATGVIEGACRHLVKDRCELSGMRWSQPGAEALLGLRSVAENGDWEAFHIFRRNERQRRFYGALPSQEESSTSEPIHCLAA